jgi:hypothetical protein
MDEKKFDFSNPESAHIKRYYSTTYKTNQLLNNGLHQGTGDGDQGTGEGDQGTEGEDQRNEGGNQETEGGNPETDGGIDPIDGRSVTKCESCESTKPSHGFFVYLG